MEGPHIPNRIRDTTRKVTFVVMAYRELTREETLQMIAVHLRTARRKPKRGETITLITSIGSDA